MTSAMKNKYLTIGIILIAVLGVWYMLSNDSILSIFRSTPVAQVSQTVILKSGDTFDLTAQYVTKNIDGKSYKMLGYNGSIPGPTIQVEQGSEITVNLKNETDMPQLLHSHGVRVDNAFDGSQTAQKEIQPGETFPYKLRFPDAGVYWYHPHVNEVYGQALGLYGAFIVKPKDPNYFPKVNREIPLFIGDLPIVDGKINIQKDDKTHLMMGHYGNIQLLNGEKDLNLTAQKGEVIRLYLINSANVRPFNFAIKNKASNMNVMFKLVGGDSGAYERPTMVDGVILGPSERAIVDVYLPDSGSYDIQNKTPDISYTLGTITVGGDAVLNSYKDEFKILAQSQATITSIDPFRTYFNRAPDKRIALTLDMSGGSSMQGMNHGGHMMPDGTMMGGSMMMNNTTASPDGIEWDTNNMMEQMMSSTPVVWKIVDRDTGKSNMDIDWVFKKDQPVKIEIYNDPKSMHPMQHPIHFHGQRFLVVSRNGVPQTNLVWKDTTLVKAGETVDIILDPSNLGTWMAHCHISEHLVSGMMFDFKVE